MARTQEQISDSIRQTIQATDNRLDLKVGPLWDYLIAPIPPELATVENKVDLLKIYYSPNFADVATADEARDFAVNFGTGPSIGNFAQAPLVFYRNSPPSAGLIYTVPVGSLVKTIDNTLVYQTLNEVTMVGDYAATYFNPSSQRYEIQVTVRAVSPGINYNIPANHIKRMQNNISGFDGIVQIGDAVGGTEPENASDVAVRVQKKFKGLEKNSMSGIETTCLEAEPTLVEVVAVVRPTDRMEFRRLTFGPSLDVYILGENITLCTEDYLASGGERSVPITTNRTITSVSSLSVNGSAIDSTQWSFLPDTSLEYQLSTRSRPSIQLLSFALSPNDLVEIVGYKNSLLDVLQVYFTEDNSIFFTDVLLRSFIELPIVVSLEARITSGDTDTISGQITTILTNFIQPIGSIPTILVPSDVTNIIKTTISEVDTVKILEFRRQYGSITTVEIISPYKNQVPVYNSLASSITVRL